MMTIFGIGFTAPVVLAALLTLPALWWILRALPPPPALRRFPGVALLIGLAEKSAESARTPWWVLALRVGALAALIVALAGPILNPERQPTGSGPLLILFDGTFADARDWPQRKARAEAALNAAQAAGRPVAVLSWADPPAEGATFRQASEWLERLAELAPAPWAPSPGLPEWLATLPGGVETLWLSDGLAHPGRAALYAALAARGPVTVFEPPTPLPMIVSVKPEPRGLAVTVARGGAALPAQTLTLTARGRDSAGAARVLAESTIAFAADAREASVTLELPSELRNRIERFELEEWQGAGAVFLADDSMRRRKVALLTARGGEEALAVLSPFHYIRQALAPVADLIEAPLLDDLLLASPDVVILVDAPGLSKAEDFALRRWVEQGGLLLRFAGPRLAAVDPVAIAEDPLLPVRLRTGGRAVGGALSWGTPQHLAPCRNESPFAGLNVPAEVEVRMQVLAQPGPELAQRSIAELADGTPLVTQSQLGQGRVVLFHVTATPAWSNLPLSGLFVDMLARLTLAAGGAGSLPATELAGRSFTREARLDGFGALTPAPAEGAVAGAELAAVREGARVPGPSLPPGLYAAGEARVAINAASPATVRDPATWPAGAVVETFALKREQPLAGWFFSVAVVALVLDVLATLALSGGLFPKAARVANAPPFAGRTRAGRAILLSFLLAGAVAATGAKPLFAEPTVGADSARPPAPGLPLDEARALQATRNVVLAFVSSGDVAVDRVVEAGLRGLSHALRLRTSVEPDPPMRVDLERDELALFPFLYWPVTAQSPVPSAEVIQKLNRYLRSGGMILFDTMDAEQAQLTGAETSALRRLRAITAGLDIPPLEPVPSDHVLTRTFYLLSDFPGRYRGGLVWVEAAPPDAERLEGMPFRHLNDGVTPVVIGSNDWAAAWAIDETGAPLLPVGRGSSGERQREMALRFGINLIMHVLSGNYKSDQVHVPALLERLGQ